MNPLVFFKQTYGRIALAGLTALICLSVAAKAADAIKLVPVFEQVEKQRPVALVVPPDGTGRQFLMQQRGQILLLPKDENSAQSEVFLDFSDRNLIQSKETELEEGLLGLAFHPKFAGNRKLYVYYTQQDMKRSVISELQVAADNPNRADPRTERILLEVPLPFSNHHSGNMLFGPDGFLYVSIGDGGGKLGGDPLRNAQNPFSLNGKIIRLDVDASQGSRQYGIPADNPFVGMDGARPEVYALGLRNPWGLHFDDDRTLWCADVGQDLWEEINHIIKGGNYGWSFRDGARPYAPRTDPPPAGTEFTEPIHEYSHAEGLSITGGVVYRGSQMPALRGAYLYGDWARGRIWALRYDKAAKKVVSNDLLCSTLQGVRGKGLLRPTAFCEDASHEVLMLDWVGVIYRLTMP